MVWAGNAGGARHQWIIIKNFLETDWIILCLGLRSVGVVTRSNALKISGVNPGRNNLDFRVRHATSSFHKRWMNVGKSGNDEEKILTAASGMVRIV